MKLQQMVGRFLAFMDDAQGGSFSFEYARQFLNQAQEEVQNLAVRSSSPVFSALATATISPNTTTSEEIDLSTLTPRFRRAIYVEKEDGSGNRQELDYVDFRTAGDFDRLIFNWESQDFYATRDVYYLRGKYMGFYRPTGFDVRITYEPQLADLVGEDDESDIPGAFHLLIVAKAAELARDLSGYKPSRTLEKIISEQTALFISYCARQQIQGGEYV